MLSNASHRGVRLSLAILGAALSIWIAGGATAFAHGGGGGGGHGGGGFGGGGFGGGHMGGGFGGFGGGYGGFGGGYGGFGRGYGLGYGGFGRFGYGGFGLGGFGWGYPFGLGYGLGYGYGYPYYGMGYGGYGLGYGGYGLGGYGLGGYGYGYLIPATALAGVIRTRIMGTGTAIRLTGPAWDQGIRSREPESAGGRRVDSATRRPTSHRDLRGLHWQMGAASWESTKSLWSSPTAGRR